MPDALIETMQPIEEVADLGRPHKPEPSGDGWKITQPGSRHPTVLRFYKSWERAVLDDDMAALEVAKRKHQADLKEATELAEWQRDNPRAVAPVAP